MSSLEQLIRYLCPNCSEEVGKDDTHCGNCGIGLKPVGASEQEQAQVEKHQEQIAEIEKDQKRQKRQAKKEAAEEDDMAKAATATRGRKTTGTGKKYTPTAGSRMAVVWEALRVGTARLAIAEALMEHSPKLDLSKARKEVSKYLHFLRTEKGVNIVELKSGPNKGKLKIR